MKAGFRGWLYRCVSLVFGLVGIAVSLTGAELARFYAFPGWFMPSGVSLLLSFLLFMTAFFGQWVWRRYLIAVFSLGLVSVLSYLAFRPEMIRDDVLKQLRTPPLTVDLVLYRSIALRNDPGRELKIERLGFIYGFLKTFGETSRTLESETSKTPIPEAT